MALSYDITRLHALRNRRDELRATYDKVQADFQTARDHLKTLQARREFDDQHNGAQNRHERPQDHEIETAEAEVERLREARDRAAEAQQAIADPINRAEEWARANAGCKTRRDKPPKDLPKDRSKLEQEIADLEAKISELRAEAETLNSAPVPLSTAEARIDNRIASLKTQAVTGGAFFTSASYREQETAQPISLPELVAVAGEQLKAQWLAEAEQWLQDHPPGPDLETRRARLSEIDEQLDGLVRRHTALVFEAWSRDLKADFVDGVSAEILLDVQGQREKPSDEPRIKGRPGDVRSPRDPTVIRA